MKKLFPILLFLLTLFVSCNSNNAISYYNQAQKIMDESFYSNTLTKESMDKVHILLDKSIESDTSFWKPYYQKIALYRIDQDYEKIVDMYDQWIDNNNKMDDGKLFSYAAALYTIGEEDKAFDIFNDLYSKNIDKLSANYLVEDEISFTVTVYSGLLTKNIKNIAPIKDYVVEGDGQATYEAFIALSNGEKFQNLFYNFEKESNENLKDLLQQYAGA